MTCRACCKNSALLCQRLRCIYLNNQSYTNCIPHRVICENSFHNRQLQYTQIRCKSGSGKDKEFSSLIEPIPFKASTNSDDINVGIELTGSLRKDDLLVLLNKFYKNPSVKGLAVESGMDNHLYHQAYLSFRRFCVETETLPVDLHIVFSDILQGAGHSDDILPYFLRHAREIYPHLECIDDLKKISDLRLPANWYSEARSIQRKIIYHAGPTNSGKTYHALESFLRAKSGVYCGPLRLLATEVFQKCNDNGTPCDLITGEERRFANPEKGPSDHIAATVEMTSTNQPYEVAVIDEIQMIRDKVRGWAWTRALLGVCAQEVHVCGEESAIDILKEMMEVTGDEVEIRKYKRLTKLTYLDKAVESFDNIREGDCIVCFSKKDIYHISRQLELRNLESAVIYGGLPPGTKLAQAQKFNDPKDPCKIMVATDAIGMGLNLCIKRIVFFSLMKPCINDKGEKEMDLISTSQAHQIGGRAGRYRTAYEQGEVTTFKHDDLATLKEIISYPIDPIVQAGLHPTADQIELFAYHLPNATLSKLIDIFVTLSQLDNDNYFMCNIDDFKFLAEVIEHIPLALRVRYVFCCAPIPKKQAFVCTMFLKFARQFHRNERLTLEWLCRQLNWPFTPPSTIADLVHLEAVFDVMDLYLWLSYRFPDMFPDTEHVRDMQKELDSIIQCGVQNITRLLKASESKVSLGTRDDEDEFEIKKKSQWKPAGASIDLSNGELPRKVKKSAKIYGGGRLSQQLLDQGLLTKEMLSKLRQEWSETDNTNSKPKNKE